MIDHETARRFSATAIDGALEPADRTALREHLEGCVVCRRVADAFGRDAAALAHLDLGPVPIAVRANVAIAAEHGRARGHVARWVGLVAVGALLLVALGGGALTSGGKAPSAPLVGNRVDWETPVVELVAADFSITANGVLFLAQDPSIQVQGDPGDATRRTLELEWGESGVRQRLSIYFANDDRTWWADEIRIYDGHEQGEWLTAQGRFFESPIGASWQGSLDLDLRDAKRIGAGPGHLHLRDAVLSMRVTDTIAEPIVDPIILGPNERPFAAGGALHCSGILQMTPQGAATALRTLGYRVSWRYVTENGGYWDPREEPPSGVIPDYDVAVGSAGELVIPVIKFGEKDATIAPFPGDCAAIDPNGLAPIPSVVISPAP